MHTFAVLDGDGNGDTRREVERGDLPGDPLVTDNLEMAGVDLIAPVTEPSVSEVSLIQWNSHRFRWSRVRASETSTFLFDEAAKSVDRGVERDAITTLHLDTSSVRHVGIPLRLVDYF